MGSKIMNASPENKLPGFKNPPVNEVVCGMRFRPTEKLRIPYIGLLWNKFRDTYPKLQHAPLISTAKGEISLDPTTGLPIPRVWFISDSDDQLIQFQTDRFYFNWRKRKNDYPRYGYVIGCFEVAFNAVKDLFRDFDLGKIDPIEYELSYINHIPWGVGWKTIDDLPEIFLDFNWNKLPARSFLPNPEAISWIAEFSLPEHKSRLAISLKQATRTEDELPVLVYELKAYGIDAESNHVKWFNLAHEWIVRGFDNLTTDKMHTIWGKE